MTSFEKSKLDLIEALRPLDHETLLENLAENVQRLVCSNFLLNRCIAFSLELNEAHRLGDLDRVSEIMEGIETASDMFVHADMEKLLNDLDISLSTIDING